MTCSKKNIKVKSTETAKSIKKIKHESILNVPAYWVEQWLLHILDRPASFLIAYDDYEHTLAEQATFDEGIAHMQSGIPLAYLTGRQEFWSLEFAVNEHTLIPRPDTEVLVEHVLRWIDTTSKSRNDRDISGHNNSNHNNDDDNRKRLLDLGTGSGCIAISLAQELTNTHPNRWQVTAVDLSAQALEVAQSNAKLNNVVNVAFVQSSWFDALAMNGYADKFDVIVSNPPYIVSDDEHLAKLRAEPLSALVAGDNGLEDIKQIISNAKCYLVRGGLLAIEHGHDQGALVNAIFTEHGYTHVKTIQDYGGNDRVTSGVL